MVKKSKNPLGGASDPRHGTEHGYSYYSCRCQPCRGAHKESQQRWLDAPVNSHGSAGYSKGCRCSECVTDKVKRNVISNSRARKKANARVFDLSALA